MSWNITHLIEILLAVLLGGCITLGVNLYLQSRERTKEYAIRNKDEIYIPLYDEIKSKLKLIVLFENPFYPFSALTSWEKFKPSMRMRVPLNLKRLVEEFEKKATDYYKVYRIAEEVLENKINEILIEVKDELTKVDTDLNRKIFDTCKGDFFTGEILNTIHELQLDRILPIRNGCSLTFESFFEKVCSPIQKKSEIIELKQKRQQLIEKTQDLGKHLESKINYILRKFERKLVRI